MVEVIPCAPHELRPGDVAAFERNGLLVLHRVIRSSGSAVRLCGDSNLCSDGEIPWSRVLGRGRVIHRRPLELRLPCCRHVRAMAFSLRTHIWAASHRLLDGVSRTLLGQARPESSV
ncbi:MAG: hypothetical protein V2A73_21560 [Pseudomonadota bacterium]